MDFYKLKISEHARKSRCGRIAEIIAHIGLGQELHRCVYPNQYGERIEILTTTGVLLVVDKTETILITAYLAQMKSIRRNYYNEPIPELLYSVLKYNKRHYRELFDISE